MDVLRVLNLCGTLLCSAVGSRAGWMHDYENLPLQVLWLMRLGRQQPWVDCTNAVIEIVRRGWSYP